ncbi:MAG: hypothetical protein KGM49_14795, partial [Sphingomonadales bacterium]|nr:hypothetical protein [Sphingomonadales bacterium]
CLTNLGIRCQSALRIEGISTELFALGSQRKRLDKAFNTKAKSVVSLDMIDNNPNIIAHRTFDLENHDLQKIGWLLRIIVHGTEKLSIPDEWTHLCKYASVDTA